MNVLVVDDQRSARRVLRDILAQAPDLDIEEAATVDEAMQLIDRRPPDLLLLDMRLTADVRDRGGLDILRRARALGITTPAVMITSMTEMADVREAMRAGAQDYVYKDELSPELLLPIVETFRERLQLKAQVARLREQVDGTFGLSAILGDSPPMDRLRKLIARVADAPATVLIRGGTGTGKELVARALHETSTRREHPFLAVNCSALPGALIESLVFGHERGAFTGADRRTKGQLELAGHGTILLDEIAEMPWELQAKLLRVLEDRRFRPLGSPIELPLHARVLAATHVDLERRILEGRFREDLFYRLNVVSIDVPSLAERDSDLPVLISAFAREFPRKLRFTDDAIARLAERRWSGNVRELRNAIQRIALLAEEDVVDAAAVDELVPDRAREDVAREIDRLARALLALPERVGSKLHVIERAVLHHAIETCGGNKSAAARMIGVDRKSLERKWDRQGRSGESEVPGSDQPMPGSDQRRPPRS
jgi:DNA-binding NtrC family response regulator